MEDVAGTQAAAPGPTAPRVSRVGEHKVGPLGRAVAGRGGAARSVDPHGMGVVAVATSGAMVAVPHSEVRDPRERASWRAVAWCVLAMAALVWLWTMGGDHATRGAGGVPATSASSPPAATTAAPPPSARVRRATGAAPAHPRRGQQQRARHVRSRPHRSRTNVQPQQHAAARVRAPAAGAGGATTGHSAAGATSHATSGAGPVQLVPVT